MLYKYTFFHTTQTRTVTADLGHSKRLELGVGLHVGLDVDAPVGAHGQSRADRLLGLLGPDGDLTSGVVVNNLTTVNNTNWLHKIFKIPLENEDLRAFDAFDLPPPPRLLS